MSHELPPESFFASLEQAPTPHENDQLVPPGQRPCPICRLPMGMKVMSGVTVDECGQHGIWLDSGKLYGITMAKSVSEGVKHRREVANAGRKGKLKGVFGGWISLFVD